MRFLPSAVRLYARKRRFYARREMNYIEAIQHLLEIALF